MGLGDWRMERALVTKILRTDMTLSFVFMQWAAILH